MGLKALGFAWLSGWAMQFAVWSLWMYLDIAKPAENPWHKPVMAGAFSLLFAVLALNNRR